LDYLNLKNDISKKISVIIPIYNMEKYLTECLNSILTQTLIDIELICIDDGSTDRTKDIVKQYQTQNKNIILLEEAHEGVSCARNLGINCSNGEYVIFMDADDYYTDKNVLAELYYTADKQGSSICGGNMKSVPLNKIDLKFKEYGWIEFAEISSYCGFTRYLFKREMLISHQIYFPQYRQYEDAVFLVKAMACAKRFFAIDKIVYNYRIIPKHIRWTTTGLIDIIQAMTEILNIAKNECWTKLYQDTVAEFNKMYLFTVYKKIISDDDYRLYCLFMNFQKMIKDASTYMHSDLVEYSLGKSEMQKKLNEIDRKKEEINDMVSKYNIILIYGAGYIGNLVFAQIKSNIKNKSFNFVISDKDKNFKNIKIINDFIEKKDECFVIIAVTERYRNELEENLKKLKFKNYIAIDAIKWQYIKYCNENEVKCL